MLVELQVVDDPERVGFYSGIIVSGVHVEETSRIFMLHPKESVFSLASLVTSPYYPRPSSFDPQLTVVTLH